MHTSMDCENIINACRRIKGKSKEIKMCKLIPYNGNYKELRGSYDECNAIIFNGICPKFNVTEKK